MADLAVHMDGIASPRWLRCIVWVGLLVGVADYAIGFGFFVGIRGAPVLRVLQHPASGLLGPEAYAGGVATALLGVALHFSIALGWAAVFAMLYRRWPALRQAANRRGRILLLGTAAGVSIWLLMNNVVVAVSPGRPYAVDSDLFWIVLVLHIPFVGMPLVWGTQHFAPTQSSIVSPSLPSSTSTA